jgi:uncharacterized protein YggU (UPF0235/DUF167 family)
LQNESLGILLQLRRPHSRVQHAQAGVCQLLMAKVLSIRVTPRSAKPGIGGWRAGADGREELEIRVAEAPADGAANDAVVRLVAKALGISRSEVTIIAGHTSRHKRVATPFEPDDLRRRLGG